MKCDICDQEVDNLSTHKDQFHESMAGYAKEYELTPEETARDAWDSGDLEGKRIAGRLIGNNDEDLAYTPFYQLPEQVRSLLISNHAYAKSQEAEDDDEVSPEQEKEWQDDLDDQNNYKAE